MDRRSLRIFGVVGAIGGGLALVALLCLGVALVRSVKPLSESTAEARIAATGSAYALTAETPTATITATLLPPTDTPTATETPQSLVPIPSPIPTATPPPTDTPNPSPTPTGTLPGTDTPGPSPTPTGTLPATDTPSPSPTPTNTPTPSSTPVPLLVRGATIYEKANGDLHVAGEVVNSTSGSICDVRVVGTFYDVADQVVAVGVAYTMLDIVGTGEAASFEVALLDPPSTVDSYDLQVEYAITDSAPLRVEVVSHQGSTSGDGDYHVLGEVRNQHAFTVSSVRVAATFYNDQDEVVRAVIYYTALETLSPGEKVPFDVALPDPPEDLVDYALTVEADRE